jgi:hypothetical protein
MSGFGEQGRGFGRVSRRRRHEADLFFAELMGKPRGAGEAEDAGEDAPYDPQLKALELSPSSTHGGTPMTSALTVAQLVQIMPKLGTAAADVQQRYLGLTNDMFRLYAIDTIESRAFFLAQATIESGEYASMVEADHRQAYKERERNPSDPTWAPSYVTPAQRADFVARGYDKRDDIGRATFRFIGRGPLQVTTSQGYRRGGQVMNVWGQELGRRGSIDDASRILHAVGELSTDPTLAALPPFAFLLSGAHFKTARPSGTSVTSMDKAATSRPPLSAEQFLGASAYMVGIGSFAQLKTWKQSQQQLVADNMNPKMVVFRRALVALCGTGTTGICANPAIRQPAPRITLPLP